MTVLLNNIDILAWNHSDMVGVNPIVASREVNIIPTARLVRHKVRCFQPDRLQII